MRGLRLALILAGVSLTAWAVQPAAARVRGHHGRTVTGMIDNIGDQTVSLSILKKSGQIKERKIQVDASTTLTLNGHPAALTDLKEGLNATVTLSGHRAVEIDVTGN